MSTQECNKESAASGETCAGCMYLTGGFAIVVAAASLLCIAINCCMKLPSFANGSAGDAFAICLRRESRRVHRYQLLAMIFKIQAASY